MGRRNAGRGYGGVEGQHAPLRVIFVWVLRETAPPDKCIIVRELEAGTVNRKGQLAPLSDEISTPSTPDRSSQTKFFVGTCIGV